MARYCLSDPGNEPLFEFRIGDRVCTKNEDGSPNMSECGVVAEGCWEGQEPAGSYDIVYKVEVEEGLFFNVKHIDLMRVP